MSIKGFNWNNNVPVLLKVEDGQQRRASGRKLSYSDIIPSDNEPAIHWMCYNADYGYSKPKEDHNSRILNVPGMGYRLLPTKKGIRGRIITVV